MNYDMPTAGDYAYAAANDAQVAADRALALERSNAKRLTALEVSMATQVKALEHIVEALERIAGLDYTQGVES